LPGKSKLLEANLAAIVAEFQAFNNEISFAGVEFPDIFKLFAGRWSENICEISKLKHLLSKFKV
jgi:hypothetical protein